LKARDEERRDQSLQADDSELANEILLGHKLNQKQYQSIIDK